mgnify:CR=1 FL=1
MPNGTRQVLRDGEFSALKNAVGPGVSSTAETARRDVTAFHVSLVEAAGGHVDRSGMQRIDTVNV